MYRNKRRFFALLELIIAISLTMIILSTLMYFYKQVNDINTQMDVVQNKAFKLMYVENRLSHTIPRAENVFNFYFFTSPDVGGLYKAGSTSLLFSFDNCVKLDKQMAYIVIGRLFLDPEGNFTLATWPAPKRWAENEPVPMKKEILLEDVESLSFEFFGKIDENQPLKWVDEWHKEYNKLPLIVRVKLLMGKGENEKELIYTFPLPNTSEPITYKQ